MNDAYVVADGSTLLRHSPRLEVLAFSLGHLGTAQEGELMDIKTNAGSVSRNSEKAVLIPTCVMVGYSREAIKQELMRRVDAVFDAAERK